jgi:hypothetical protein
MTDCKPAAERHWNRAARDRADDGSPELGRSLLIKSVNPEYQAYERIAEEVNVVGRVLWAARRF